MTNNNYDRCIATFKALACDSSHDQPTHPNTAHLQNFIKSEVLPQGTKDEQADCFMDFLGTLAHSFGAAVDVKCCEFKDVVTCLPAETPDQRRIKHAVDKVGLQLGLRNHI